MAPDDEAFDARGIPVVVISNTTGKAWVTGAGRASKLDMIDTIDEWFGDHNAPLAKWRKKDNPDDVADALGYANGRVQAGDPVPFEPKERH